MEITTKPAAAFDPDQTIEERIEALDAKAQEWANEHHQDGDKYPFLSGILKVELRQAWRRIEELEKEVSNGD